jgi:hypothetical protein
MLVIGAVSLYLLSFLFAPKISPINSLNAEVKSLENYIDKREKEFDEFSSDTSLINKLANKIESVNELEQLTRKSTGLFIFQKSSLATGHCFGVIKEHIRLTRYLHLATPLISSNLKKVTGFIFVLKKLYPKKITTRSLLSE